MKFHLLIPSLMMLLAIFSSSCDQKKKAPPVIDQSTTASQATHTAKSGQAQKAGQNPPLNQIIDAMKKKQAGGLGSGSVKVNKAWTYNGYSVLDAVPGARLVAVDATVTGHTPAFDFDDIEIIDGASRMSYGSDPHITVLTSQGKILTDNKQAPKPGDPIRVLLIYGFPKKTQNFTLYYWGKNLLLKNQTIEANGWELPFPKNK